MKFHYEVLDELRCEESMTDLDGVGINLVEITLKSHSRWTIIKRLVFEKEGRYFSVDYQEPATEYQEVEAFDADSNGMVECHQVFKRIVEVVVYE